MLETVDSRQWTVGGTCCQRVSHTLQIPHKGHGFFVPYLGLLYTANTVQQQCYPHHCLRDGHGTSEGEGEGQGQRRRERKKELADISNLKEESYKAEQSRVEWSYG